MNWIKINKNTYECETPYWHFFIETNPNGNNILSTDTNKILLKNRNVRQCFYWAFDLNLSSMRDE